MKKIFITGTESFVGKELIKQLDDSYQITGCDIIKPTDDRFFKSDIGSEKIFEIVPDNVDAIIHLAALSTDPQCSNNAYNCFDVNIMGTLNLINVAQTKKCKQFIFASSEWVYDNCTNQEEKTEDSVINIANLDSEYALSKIVGEVNLKQKYNHGFCDTSILRFGIIYGTRKNNWSAVESIFNTVKSKNQIEIGSLKTGRCFVHVKDIAKGIKKAIGLKGFNVINLEGREFITLGKIIDTSKKILSKNITVVEKDRNNISSRKVSSKKSKEVLGWEPEIDLEDGLRDLNNII